MATSRYHAKTSGERPDDQGGEPDGWLPANTRQKPQVRDQDDQGGKPDGWLPADTRQKPQVRHHDAMTLKAARCTNAVMQ